MGLEQLTMLNAKVCRFDTGAGGLPGLVPEDIAGALVGLYRPANLLVLRVVGGDESVNIPLLQYLSASVALQGRADGWISDKVFAQLEVLMMEWIKTGYRSEVSGMAARVFGLAQGLLVDCLQTCRCKRCGGRGFLLNNAACKRCSGTGWWSPSERQRAGWCGISKSKWSERWQPRFEALRTITQGWYNQADRHLKRQMRNDAVVVSMMTSQAPTYTQTRLLEELAAVYRLAA